MISRIRIKGYKSLYDVELSGLTRLVLLFGPNAAGKSNFLDALDLLSRLAKEDTLIDAFQRHRGNRVERAMPVRWFFSATDTKTDHEYQEMSFEVDFELQPQIVKQSNDELEEREKRGKLERSYTRVTRRRLRYQLKLHYSHEARSLEVSHESLAALRIDGQLEKNIVPYIKRESENRISVKLERQSHPRIYGFPRTRTLLSEIGDTVNHPHVVALSRELRSARVYYVEPTRMRTQVSDVEATDPGPHGEQLASFFYWLKREHAVVFRNLLDNLRRIVPSLEGIDVKEVEDFLELSIKERSDREFPAALVSEGTLRLLCLLGIAATPVPPAVVGYEEPENGVNPARLREMLAILDKAARAAHGTQFFLTSHSPDVIDFFGEADRFLCQQGDKGTVFTRDKEMLPLFRKMRAERSLGGAVAPESSLGERIRRGDLG